MNKDNLEKIVIYIVNQGLNALKNNTRVQKALVDYVAIFSKDDDENQSLNLAACSSGEEIDKDVLVYIPSEPLSERLKETEGGGD